MNRADDPLLEVEDLVVRYGDDAPAPAVDGVSLTLCRGEALGLVGESGSGKSTLARTIVGLVRPLSGDVRLAGRSVVGLPPKARRALCRRLQLVFQDPYGSLDPRLSVADAVAEPIRVHGLARRAEVAPIVDRALAEVGLDPAECRRRPHELSGGQRQRVGLARALVLEPEVLILDEPVSALDVSVQALALDLLLDLRRRRDLTLLFIAHDLAVVRRVSDRVAVMAGGRIVESGPRDDVYERPLHPYTRALLAAAPIPDPEAEARRRASRPTGLRPAAGLAPACPFTPGCPLAAKRCREEEPRLLPHRPGHDAACHLAEENA